ncbi:hypothetical protein [Nocardia sp. NPDC049526]|uniref:hypothetical protein n=1 Tax=Nocardia sp. NPDC049526 TaxID=3364316 RepID=UPI0037AE8961
MTGSNQRFFDQLDWFDQRHCARLGDELRWARAQCPVVRSDFGGGMHIVTRYADLGTVAARLQPQIALDRILARLTNFRLVPDTTIRPAVGISVGAPEELQPEFDRVA